MSRSTKKTPYHGIAGDSDGADKRFANRAWRRAVKMSLRRDPDASVVPAQREISDVYGFAKDGKKYFDTARFPELMRK